MYKLIHFSDKLSEISLSLSLSLDFGNKCKIPVVRILALK